MNSFIEKSKGLQYEDDTIEVFFGNKHFALSELTNLKPIGVHAVKQTHSDIFHVVERPEPIHPQPEGDALGTQVPKQYLAIKTADCLPVMIHDPQSKKVAAIHAGWKGVAIRIVPKAVAKYFQDSKHLRVFIGPHITKKSFEIKTDVLDQLKASLPNSAWSQVDIELKGERFHVDLVQVVKLQIETQFPAIKLDILNSNLDTKTTEDFNSHRRDTANAGRNISYIRLK